MCDSVSTSHNLHILVVSLLLSPSTISEWSVVVSWPRDPTRFGAVHPAHPLVEKRREEKEGHQNKADLGEYSRGQVVVVVVVIRRPTDTDQSSVERSLIGCKDATRGCLASQLACQRDPRIRKRRTRRHVMVW
jgi:hypothetical protein